MASALKRKHGKPSDTSVYILSKVAICREHGFLVERGHEQQEFLTLVEDGYLAHDVRPGTSRSYSRFRLTRTGRQALVLKTWRHAR